MGSTRERRDKDGNTRYVALYRDLRGRQRSAGTFTSHKQAIKAWQRAEALVESGRLGDLRRGRQTLRTYVEKTWLPAHQIEASTRERYTYMIGKHLMPEFGAMRMIDVLPEHIRDWIAGQKATGLSASTIAGNKTILSAIFTTALADQVVFLHPCAGVKTPHRRPQAASHRHTGAVRRHPPRLARRHHPTAGRNRDRIRPALGRTHRAPPGRSGPALPDAHRQPRRHRNHRPRRRRPVRRQGLPERQGIPPPQTQRRRLHHAPRPHRHPQTGPRRPAIPARATRRRHQLRHDRNDPRARDDGRRGTDRADPAERPRADLPHGTLTAYTLGKCRCPHCKTTFATYRADRRGAGKDSPRGTRIVNTDGHLPRRWFRHHIWTPATRTAQLPVTVRFHDLRHAHASWLLAGGADIQTVKERLGHGSLRTTEKYLHTLPIATTPPSTHSTAPEPERPAKTLVAEPTVGTSTHTWPDSAILWMVVTRMSIARSAGDGCYDASRAAALSGVPKTTVYWWASHGIVVPSVSPVREKLWSYSDLMALRVVSWLRHAKPADDGSDLPASPMPKVRRALALLDELALDPWRRDAGAASPLLVDRAGDIFLRAGASVLNLHRQPVLLSNDILGLTAPFDSAGMPGPDLLRPRPHLRIVPSKVAGEPHVEHSRLTTQTIAALAARGYAADHIADMYDETAAIIDEAIDLEQQLALGDHVAA